MKGFIPAEENYSLYEGFCLEGMKRLADYGGSKGVPLYLEAINRYELNYLNTIDDTLNFLNKINSPAVKILVDTFHMNIEEPDIAQSIINCGQFLGHVHLADSNRHYPGAGHINFEAVIEALKIIGYEGYSALECMAFPSSLEAAKKGLDYLNTLGKVSS